MKLWKIYQDVNDGDDTYDSAIVVAADQEAARFIHPKRDGWREPYSTWAERPDQVGAICVGEAAPNMEPGTVVLASFNAG
jgi:hypothetical protein